MAKFHQLASVAACLFLAPASAWAQALSSISAPAVKQSTPFIGPLSGVGQALDDKGIDIHIVMNDALANNVSTGDRVGRTSNSLSNYIGADFDLGKVVGIQGGTIHTGIGLFFARVRNGPRVNAIQDVSSLLGGDPVVNRSRSWYLTTLSYEQKLFNNRLDFEIGRINAKRDFDLPYAGNSYSGGDPLFSTVGGTSPAPFAHWGGRVAYRATPRWHLGFGTFEVFPKEIRTFGTDFRIDQAAGVLFVTNAVYQTHFSNSYLPSRYEIVSYHNTSPVSDPLHPQSTHSGAYGFALRVQQTIWRPRETSQGAMPPHLDLLGLVSYTPDHYVITQSDEEVGIGLYGFIPSAPRDSVQLKAAHLRLTDNAIEFQRQSRFNAGGPDVATSPDQFRFEINGDFAIGRAISFQPIVEYILNPDSDGLPNSPNVPRSGFVVAAMFVAKPGVLLGISQG